MAVADVSAVDTIIVVCVPTRIPLSCTQFGFQQDGAPAGQPSIASRVVTPEWGLVSVFTRVVLVILLDINHAAPMHISLPRGVRVECRHRLPKLDRHQRRVRGVEHNRRKYRLCQWYS